MSHLCINTCGIFLTFCTNILDISLKFYMKFKILFFSLEKIKTLNYESYNTTPLSCRGQIALSNIDEICPLVIPNRISLISMHVPWLRLVKILWHLHKLSSRNENMGVSWADNSVKIWRNWSISNPKSNLHNINAHTKFGETPLMFTPVIIRKRNMDRRTDVRMAYNWRADGQTHGRPTWNHNTPPLSCGGVQKHQFHSFLLRRNG